MTPNVETKVNYELNLLEKLSLSGYFLIAWDIMDYAEKNDIPAIPTTSPVSYRSTPISY